MRCHASTLTEEKPKTHVVCSTKWQQKEKCEGLIKRKMRRGFEQTEKILTGTWAERASAMALLVLFAAIRYCLHSAWSSLRGKLYKNAASGFGRLNVDISTPRKSSPQKSTTNPKPKTHLQALESPHQTTSMHLEAPQLKQKLRRYTTKERNSQT